MTNFFLLVASVFRRVKGILKVDMFFTSKKNPRKTISPFRVEKSLQAFGRLSRWLIVLAMVTLAVVFQNSKIQGVCKSWKLKSCVMFC